MNKQLKDANVGSKGILKIVFIVTLASIMVALSPIILPNIFKFASNTTLRLYFKIADSLENHADRMLYLAYGYSEKGNYEKAITLCLDLLNEKDLSVEKQKQCLFLLGGCYLETKQADEAIKTSDCLTKIDPAYGSCLKGGALLIKGALDDAMRELKKCKLENEKFHSLDAEMEKQLNEWIADIKMQK